ncbi:MAG TPA: hypothetical protein VF787_28150 [Thermoanaerobaculia bacterium]
MAGPYWELHILPMFRLIDRDHMLVRGLDLFDYAQVSKAADDIIDQLEAGMMPPQSTGGPWPDEWITVFKNWRDNGKPRLTLIGDATYSLTKNGDFLLFVATGQFAGNRDTGWFERANTNESPREYTLVAALGPPGNSKPYKIQEKTIPATQTQVVVTDARGKHVIHVT